jgi:hypothetical protein
VNTTALLASALFVGVVVVGLLVADAAVSVLDLRRVTVERSDADHLGRERVRELSWTVVITAALAVIVAFAADSAARLVWTEGRPVAGAFVLLGVTLLSGLVGLVAVAAVVRRERPSYALIRRELRDRSPSAIDADVLHEFEDRLARADRLRARRPRAAMVLRIVGVVVMLGLTVVAGIALPIGALFGFSAAALLGGAAFLVTARAHAVTDAAISSVLDAQRAEVVALLERARIPARGRVPGLGTRVARALAILRERQNSGQN